MNKRQIQLILMCIVGNTLLFGVKVLVIFIFILVYCWLLHSLYDFLAPHYQTHLSTSFPLPSSQRYNPNNVLLIIYVHIVF